MLMGKYVQMPHTLLMTPKPITFSGVPFPMENKSKLKVEEDGDPLLSLHASLYLAGLHKNNNFET